MLNPTEEKALKLLQKISGPNFNVLSLNEEFLKHWYYMLKYSRIEKGIGLTRFDNEAISISYYWYFPVNGSAQQFHDFIFTVSAVGRPD
jgi:hypothetical protein